MNQLRSEGRCFHCKKEGHEARNCPDRKILNAPRTSRNNKNQGKVSSSSIRFSKIERLAKKKTEIDMNLFSMRIREESRSDPEVIHDLFQVPWLQRHLTIIYGPESALVAGIHPVDRFIVTARDSDYICEDTLIQGSPLSLPKRFVQSPGFDLRWVLTNTRRWREKMLTSSSEEYQIMCQQIQLKFCQGTSVAQSVRNGIRHAERFNVTYRSGGYEITDRLHPNTEMIIPQSGLIDETWSVEGIIAETVEVNEEIEEEDGSIPVQIMNELRTYFGPEESFLHHMTPSTRFSVRLQEGGVRIFEDVFPELPLFVRHEELQTRVFHPGRIYARAARELEGPGFNWDNYRERLHQRNRTEFCNLLWRRFMDHFQWPRDIWNGHGQEQQFTVDQYGEDYEVTDWTDISISHLVKLDHLERDEWDVPMILQRTELIKQELELEHWRRTLSGGRETSDGNGRSESLVEGSPSIILNSVRPTKGKMSRKDEKTDHLLDGLERSAMLPRVSPVNYQNQW